MERTRSVLRSGKLRVRRTVGRQERRKDRSQTKLRYGATELRVIERVGSVPQEGTVARNAINFRCDAGGETGGKEEMTTAARYR